MSANAVMGHWKREATSGEQLNTGEALDERDGNFSGGKKRERCPRPQLITEYAIMTIRI